MTDCLAGQTAAVAAAAAAAVAGPTEARPGQPRHRACKPTCVCIWLLTPCSAARAASVQSAAPARAAERGCIASNV